MKLVKRSSKIFTHYYVVEITHYNKFGANPVHGRGYLSKHVKSLISCDFSSDSPRVAEPSADFYK